MTIIRTYMNGNYRVMLHHDGTKERLLPGGPPSPVFPESIDLKVTEMCDKGCRYCHESAFAYGHHALPENVASLTSGLPAGVEIAVGGGDPLAHPYITEIVQNMNWAGLIVNMTVHNDHLGKMTKEIRQCIYGLGVSKLVDTVHSMLGELFGIDTSNVVSHAIAGIDKPNDFLHCPKLLILGFKRYGRGLTVDPQDIEKNIREWRFRLPGRLSQRHVTAFDNLALEQLRIKDIVPPDVWERSYMGNDGEFTMYIDAVKMEYGVSSTSERKPIPPGRTARELFVLLRQQCDTPNHL